MAVSLTASNKLQLLWDYFIHAEPQSYEKSSWLDIFLAEFLARVHEGEDVNEILSFWSIGVGGVSTLIACEILADIHDLCALRNDGGELIELRKYLIQGRGWRSLAVLHLLGVRGLSCGRELVALLVALYPVALQEATERISSNPYVRFYSNDDIVDTIDIIPHTKKRWYQYNRTNIINDTISLRKRSRRHSNVGTRNSGYSRFIRKKSINEKSDHQNDISSESGGDPTDGIDQARSSMLKIRLNPMDFEYFTCVVRSDEEKEWPTNSSTLIGLQHSEGPQNLIDQRVKAVLEMKISNFETCLLIIQLLQSMRDYDTPAEQTPVVQVLKFALDTLWSLQFGNDAIHFSGIECATLKAAAARLMLTSLERVLKADEPTTAVIHNGLLPMTLRLIEDACSKRMVIVNPEEGTLLQEFIFATTYGIITFLYCLFHQRAATKKLGDFLELFQLFTDSQDGKLIERTILTIVELPSTDASRSMSRMRKVIDMVGALISTLNRVRQELCNMDQCHRPKHQHINDSDTVEIYHHNDILGIAYCEPVVGSILKQACCISSLFMILIGLIKESHVFEIELKIRLLKVITAAGTCCCFSPKILLVSIVNFMKSEMNNQEIYGPCIALLERCLFKQLGAISSINAACNICVKSPNNSWDCLQLYEFLLTPDNSNMCYIIMAHLLRITPMTNFYARRELLFNVFYPTLMKEKKIYSQSKYNVTAEFIIQSCLSIISSLIINNIFYDKFMELNGLQEVLELLPKPEFTRSICNILEVSVIMEMSKISENHTDVEVKLNEGVALNTLFKILEQETNSLLRFLENIDNVQFGDVTSGSLDNTVLDMDKLDHIKEKLSQLKEKLTHHKLMKKNQSCIDANIEEKDKEIVNFYHVSAVWRVAAGVALCSPRFRIELSKSKLAPKLLRVLKALAICIATTQNVTDVGKPTQRLLEALITCSLISPLQGCDMIGDLSKAFMNVSVTLGHAISVLVEALLRVSMLKPSEEQTTLQPTRPRLPTMAPESSSNYDGGDDSSAGEYVTADDGYEADIENYGRSPRSNLPKRTSSLGPVTEPRGNANAHPALCSLAVDLLIHFGEQGLDAERCAIVSSGLRKVVVTCKESASSCAALAGSGTINRLLSGFESILISEDSEYRELQHAVLEVFTLLATQSISSAELLNYLALFKVQSPPLSLLLQPLFRLVLISQPQPNFILPFPCMGQSNIYLNINNEDSKNTEKTANLVNNFRKKHSAYGICSPWSVHAVCLPVGPELLWSVWLNGCSASMWIRVERGSLLCRRSTGVSAAPVFNSSSESLSEWGVLSDNWSNEVIAGSTSPPMPATIIHFISIGFESLVLEMWLDLQSNKLIIRLTRPDEKINRTISETSINGMLSGGRWHNLSFNVKDTILNKRSAVVEVVVWVDGWRETTVQLPFDGLLVRKPGTSCALVGQLGVGQNGAWYLGNLMLFRCPVFTKERALYLTSLGPNYTNLADCILNTAKSNLAPLIASGALNGIRKIKFDNGKFDVTRRKSYGGTYFRHVVETKVLDSKINWDAIMDATNSYLCELQDNILLCYEAQSPNVVNLYPQAIAHPSAVVRNLFPGQPGFRVVSAPEHRVSQQPPLSVATISPARLERQQYRGLIPAASSIGGIPIFLYLFARVVELNSNEEDQALALSIVLHLVRSDSDLLSQYRSEGGPSLLLRVLDSSRCHAGKYMLKAIFDAACDSSIIVKDVTNGNHIVLQNSEAIVTDAELIKESLEAWKTWVKFDALNMFLQAILMLLRDQHSHREFNAGQLNRAGIVETILLLCKKHFMYEDLGIILDTTTGNAIVELVRALMGAPPEFSHLVAIMDYLVLVHQASDTYVTHSRHNIYFLLPPLESENKINVKSSTTIPKVSITRRKAETVPVTTPTTMTPTIDIMSTSNTPRNVSSSDESIETLGMSKSNKALINVQIQRDRVMKKRERRIDNSNSSGVAPSKEMSAEEDSGIAASDGSNHHTSEKYLSWTDGKCECQGLVSEGLLLLLRDALRVLPDNQVVSILKHVIRAELLLVLINDADVRVRTAIIKVIQAYLQRANDEDINKFTKQKYFFHLANQISLYAGSESLITALENLAMRGPVLAAMPPLLSMLIKCAATEPNIARPIVSFITDIIAKNANALRTLLGQGLAECLAQALVGGAHKGNSTSLFNDIHVLLLAIATKLLELPGNHQMQAISELHLILNYVELNERYQCGANVACVSIIRTAQVVLFDGELDALMSKMSVNPGFRLRSAASYVASASYLTTILTTSSDQSDQESRSSSYGSLYSSGPSHREPGRGEIFERFRTILFKAVEFITTADRAPISNELELTKRLFTMLLHGLSSPYDKKNYWGGPWSSRPTLRKNAAKMMIWLLGPHQSNNIRVYAVRSLMEEPRGREILSSLLEVHPQIEQKFTVYFWDLLQKRNDLPCTDARLCMELKEALSIWELVKGINNATPQLWSEELSLLRRELIEDREIWIENNFPAIHRIGNKFDLLAKQIIESAMVITRTVIEEQNRERKVLMEKLKHGRAMEAQAMARWRDLTRRLTHERAPWYFSESYPPSWELDPTEGPARVRIRLQRCHLKIEKRFFLNEQQTKLDAENIEGPLSYLFTTVRQDANAEALIERLHTSERIRKMSQARVVTPSAESTGEVLIGETCLYFVPDKPDMPLHTDIALGGLDLAMAGGTAWRLEDIRELHRRRYQLQERAIEIFLTTGRTYLLAFNSSRERDEFTSELSTCNLPQRVPGDDLGEALAMWRNGNLTNWEYITCLNKLAGRSYNDLMQYPVFPFVLADYVSDRIDLTNSKMYRNFKRPMAVQDKKNEQHYIHNYNYLKQALLEGHNLNPLNQEPYHYGSHYSNSGTVLHFLVRLPPFTSMFLRYQDDNFDIPDRTFHALATTWRLTSCDSTTDVKELIPEFFYLPEFLLNFEGFNFGVRQNGCRVGDVELPAWCEHDVRLFILAHRAALESDIVRENLPYWIDLVFGFRQTGKPAVEAINVFHPATYYGFNVDEIADPLVRAASETMVKTYGQTPAQLFTAAHPLAVHNAVNISGFDNIPPVIESVEGIKWGNYVGAPGNEPVLCWKHKNRIPMNSLIPLTTGDVFGLPIYTTLLLGYNREKGINMLSGTSVLAAAVASWGNNDGIVRLKSKKDQPPRPLIQSSGFDPITVLGSAADCGQLWLGHFSGRITVYSYNIETMAKIKFTSGPASVLLAHRSVIKIITLSRAFSIAVSADDDGVVVIWDLNSLSYVRSIVCNNNSLIDHLAISETLGDIALTCQLTITGENQNDHRSELKVFTINARPVGSVLSRRKMTSLCYSNAPEGVSVNVIATGLDNGVIRLWSSWNLRLVREIVNGGKDCGGIIAIAWALDQHHLYAATEDSTVLIWEGIRRLSNGTPKFVNLTSL